ncbi:gamma-glutamyltransferase family protein [Paracandidimonas soli]|uniref:gamma-glutamyltransferase family protein n=1 Tax=Paracandidimonas soli TaxID=1917182 RepID=UPI00333FACB0
MNPNARAKSLYGARGAVVSGHHLATLAASDILRQGGSLIDAVIASSAVLTVALPHTSSMGGCAMLLYFDAATGRTHALNGSGKAPLAADRAMFERMPQRGSRSWLTPALVRFWARAYGRFGALPWPGLFEPAIALARQGLACPEELARNLARADDSLLSQPGFREAFLPRGDRLSAGDMLVQPRVADVLSEIADKGEDGFYKGWVADSLLAFSASTEGLLSAEDLEGASADWVSPLAMAAGDVGVQVMPPNSSGWIMLEQLRRNWGGGLEVRATQDKASAMADAILAAIDVIAHKDRDPQEVMEAYAAGHAGECALPVKHRFSAEPGDTTGFVAMDAQGNAVSMLQSIFQPFGSGCVDPGTGIIFNNRMYDFSLSEDSPNRLRPGQRPVHTLNPYLVMRREKLVMAGVSPGGVSQTTTGFQVIDHAMRSGMSLGAVVSEPRWSLGRDGTVLLEEGIDGRVAQRLRERGLTVVENSAHEFYFGSVKAVRALEGGRMLEAAADPRRQAHAIVW